jgi:hypothetical protein
MSSGIGRLATTASLGEQMFGHQKALTISPERREPYGSLELAPPALG